MNLVIEFASMVESGQGIPDFSVNIRQDDKVMRTLIELLQDRDYGVYISDPLGFENSQRQASRQITAFGEGARVLEEVTKRPEFKALQAAFQSFLSGESRSFVEVLDVCDWDVSLKSRVLALYRYNLVIDDEGLPEEEAVLETHHISPNRLSEEDIPVILEGILDKELNRDFDPT